MTFASTGTRRRVEDPIKLRVLSGQFTSIAQEIAATLQRTGYSQLTRESEDLGAGLFDCEGREIAEARSTPLLNGALGGMIRGFLQRLDGTLRDGDIILHNHPYKGAMHAPDVCVATPIFWGGELVAFAANSCHLVDVGGAYPGINVDVVDMWSEAMIFDSIKLFDAGVRNEVLWQNILDNTRTPSLTKGDLEALVGAARRGRARFLALLERYGRQTVFDAAADLQDYSEHMLRSAIAAIPDGSYEAPVGWLDDDGRNRGIPLKVCVKVTVSGSDIEIDLTSSNPEVETGFNAPFEGATQAAARFIVRTVFLDEATTGEDVPQNEGCYRPIRVVAPKGTIFNPRFPRATFARFCPINRVADSFVLALADVAPDRVTAGSAAHTFFISYSGVSEDTEDYWTYIEINEGSYGARAGHDGMDAVDTLMANTMNSPVEEVEMQFPLRVERYELRDAPVAPGRWRGGIGPVRVNRFLVDAMSSCEGDRTVDPPRGLRGGGDGLPGGITLIGADGSERPLPAKFSGYVIRAGEAIRLEGPMGGGYGDPLERDPADVLRDVRDGHVSIDEAAHHYGVVLTADGTAVDTEATRAHRLGRPIPEM
jgi:N-methylhydantoinase B/oxoprolinase/acetone carboxylase alpha subunit